MTPSIITSGFRSHYYCHTDTIIFTIIVIFQLGNTPLHYAVLSGDLRVVRGALVASGNAPDLERGLKKLGELEQLLAVKNNVTLIATLIFFILSTISIISIFIISISTISILQVGETALDIATRFKYKFIVQYITGIQSTSHEAIVHFIS